MNIIEAAQAMRTGSTVFDEMGFQYKASPTGLILIGEKDPAPAELYLSDIFSKKWTLAHPRGLDE